jgi:hypothetical protein
VPSLWDSFADLEVKIDDYSVQRRELAVSSEFTRVTSTVVMKGAGETGQGEDVTYVAGDHDSFPTYEMLAGTWTLHEYSVRLEEIDLWRERPQMEASVDYRRWAFESAALDLGLRQAGLSFAQLVGRPYRPVRFVASTRADIAAHRELDPELEFKLDVHETWDEPLMRALADTDRVRVLDLKAYYRGTGVDLEPNAELYRTVARIFPTAVLEDPWLEGECGDALRVASDRISFDAPIHSWADVGKLPISPRWLNIKPSRFGTIRRLTECIEACEEGGISMYGGGQFELGPGRRQIQRLASVFYADGPNDVAPSEYNEGPPRPGLSRSPLPPPEGPGF